MTIEKLILPAIDSQWESRCTGAIVKVEGFTDGELADVPYVVASGGLDASAGAHTIGPAPWFLNAYRPQAS